MKDHHSEGNGEDQGDVEDWMRIRMKTTRKEERDQEEQDDGGDDQKIIKSRKNLAGPRHWT